MATAKAAAMTATKKAEQAATPADDPIVRVLVKETGVTTRGVKCAVGAKPRMSLATAKVLEEKGKVEIIGD